MNDVCLFYFSIEKHCMAFPRIFNDMFLSDEVYILELL